MKGNSSNLNINTTFDPNASFDKIAAAILGSIRDDQPKNLEKLIKFETEKNQNFVKEVETFIKEKYKFSPISYAIDQNKAPALKILLEKKFTSVATSVGHKENEERSALEWLFKRYIYQLKGKPFFNPIELLKCLLHDPNNSVYDIDLPYLIAASKKSLEVTKQMFEIDNEGGKLWKKLKLINPTVEEPTERLVNYLDKHNQFVEDFQKKLENLKGLIEKNTLSSEELKQIYSTLQKALKHCIQDSITYGKKDQSVFIKAVNLKNFVVLEVMLKALNNLSLDDNTHTLNSLVILSAPTVEGLFEACIKNIKALSKYNQADYPLVYYAVKANNLDYVKKLASKTDLTIDSDLKNLAIFEAAENLDCKDISDRLKKVKVSQENLKLSSKQKAPTCIEKQEEKFKVPEVKQKPKTTKEEKNNILKNLYAQYKEQEIMSQELLEALEEKGIVPDDYKKFAISQKEQEANSKRVAEDTGTIHSWVIAGKQYSTDKNEIFCHKLGGKEYYIMLDEALKDTLQKAQVLDKVQNYLADKGFAQREKDDTGLKLFGEFNNVLEVKTFNNKQPYTDVGYINKDREILFIISKYRTHKKIMKVAEKSSASSIMKDESVLKKMPGNEGDNSSNFITFFEDKSVDSLGEINPHE